MIEAINFPNVGFLKVSLTAEEVSPILTEVEKIKESFENSIEANKNLVGNIKKEYLLTDCVDHLDLLISKYAQEFENNFKLLKRYDLLSDNKPLIISRAWVNFQEKYEFNPIHDHAGLMSFVIWLKIPFLIKDEDSQGPGSKSNSPLSGRFCFNYTDSLGAIQHYDIPADQTMENTLLIFPAKMTHAVYPFFTSDEYRISVSGNVVFQV